MASTVDQYAEAKSDSVGLVLSHDAMFMEPRFLETSGWLEHVPFAFWIVEAHDPAVVVELGTHRGISFFAFCQAIKMLRRDSHCYAVDTWEGDEQAGFYSDVIYDSVTQRNNSEYSEFATLLRMTFDSALDEIPDGSVDLLHIDGLHTYEAVEHDFSTWLPKMSRRGVILFHDTNVRASDFGVYEFFARLRQSYPSFEFLHGNGLGVLAVGDEIGESVAALMACSREPDAEQRIRNAFSRLGAACTDRVNAQEARVLAAEVTAEKNAIYHWALSMESDIEKSKADYSRLESEFEDRSRWVLELDQKVEQVSAAETQLRSLVDDYARQNESLKSTLQMIVHSKSWWLTKPLRFAARVLRGDWTTIISSLRASDLANSPVLTSIAKPAKHWLMRQESAQVQQIDGLILPEVLANPQRVLERVSFPHHDNPTVTIIVPTYGNLTHTLACLHSIYVANGQASYEVLVAEDASGDPEIGQLKMVPGLRYHENEKNLGFLMSCNAASKMARGQYTIFLNNDTEVRDGWLDALLKVFHEHPMAGLVGAKLIYPDGRLQEAGGIVWSDATAWNYGRLQNPRAPEYCYLHEADYISGAAIMLPTKLLSELGCFDPHYLPAYCEDTDLAFRVRDAGYKVYYQPEAVVVHYEGISHGTDTARGVKAHQVENQKKLRERWRELLEESQFENAELPFLAKDRSQLCKTVLMIDHYVPQPDRDAGSRTMWQFVNVFQKHHMSVKFWPDNLWYDEAYTPKLQQRGVEVIYGGEYVGGFEHWIRKNGACIDYVLLSRPHVSVKYIDALRRHSKAKLLYYGHDIHHQRLNEQLRIAADPVVEAARDKVQLQEERLWREVDAVYYPSELETSSVEEWMKARGARTRNFTIPVYAFDTFPAIESDPRKRYTLLFVAGFNHTPNADAAVWFVNQVLPLIRSKIPEIRVDLVGSNPKPEVVALKSESVNVSGYVSDEELACYYHRARVVVAPLRFGGGMKGKVVEAMRFGVPIVTSDAGAQGLQSAQHFLRVAKDEASFAEQVIRLLQDDEAWSLASSAAQDYAKANFSEEALWRIVAEDVDPSPYENVQARRERIRSASSNRN